MDTESEVKGLWFVVARRYLVDRPYEARSSPVAVMAEPGRPPRYREALPEPMRSAWYPEACLQEFMRAFDDLVTHGDKRRLIAAFEECTLAGVHRFFQALSCDLTSPRTSSCDEDPCALALRPPRPGDPVRRGRRRACTIVSLRGLSRTSRTCATASSPSARSVPSRRCAGGRILVPRRSGTGRTG